MWSPGRGRPLRKLAATGIRIGVIGLHFGRTHCERILANPRLALAAICGVDVGRFLFAEPETSGEGRREGLVLDTPPVDAYAAEMDHFADVIEGRCRPLCDAPDGATSVDCILAIRESSRLSRPIDIQARAPTAYG